MTKFLRLVCIAGFVFGAVEIWNWVRHRNPVEVVFTSNEVRELPKHVLLKKVFLLPTDVASKGGLGGKQLYIPIRAMDDGSAAKSLHFVLKTDDPELLAAVEQANAGLSLEEAMVALKPLLAKREISGMQESGDLTRKQRLKLREQFPVLAEDFTVIEEGRHPSLFTAGFLFAVGGLALFVLGKIDPSPVDAEPAGAEPPTLAAAPTSTPPPPIAIPPRNLAAEPPLLPTAASANLRPALVREPEIAGNAASTDPVTAGISLINPGTTELPPGWLRAFAKADIVVVSVDGMKPQNAHVFGPGDYVGVFTQLELAQQCLRQLPQLKYAIRLKGRALLGLAESAERDQ